MSKLAIILLLPYSLFAQQLVYTFKFDTVQYTRAEGVYSIPSIFSPQAGMLNAGNINWVLRKKNSDQYDIFSITGKIGSVTVPQSITPNGWVGNITASQTIIDSDSGWEYIIWYEDTINNALLFKVIDDNGSQLLADTSSNHVLYGYDGQNTYVVAIAIGGYPSKVWKFRSDVRISNPQCLSKSITSPIGSIQLLMPSGDLRVNLQPASGGTAIQIYDMLGRQLTSKTIKDIRSPMNFIIPSAQIPNSPFIMEVKNNNGYLFKKEIPIH